MSSRLKAHMSEHSDVVLQWHATLQTHRDGDCPSHAHPLKGGALFGKIEEDFTQLLVLRVQTHGQKTLEALDPKLVLQGGMVLGHVPLLGSANGLAFLLVGKRLHHFTSVPIDGHRFHPVLPALNIRLQDLFHRGLVGKIDGFRDRSGEKRLYHSAHLDVAEIIDGSTSIHRPVRAVKDSQVVLFEMGCALDRFVLLDIPQDVVDIPLRITHSPEGSRNHVVHDLQVSSSYQSFDLHQ